jgi:hypothetical protein
MLKIRNEPIILAVQRHPEPKYRQAILSGSTEPTFNKLLEADPGITMEAAAKIAEYYGYDTELRFVKKSPVAEPAPA